MTTLRGNGMLERAHILKIGIATACWLLLACSVGWYYTVTYFGHVGWPMPSVETVGALLLYYFSVLNVDTEIQAVHWLLVFPAAGYLWVAVLIQCQRDPAARPSFSRVAFLLGLASLPLSIPMPYMAWLAGFEHDGAWTVHRMLAVALRRGNLTPWPWLSPMYLGFGAMALAVHLYVFWRQFPGPWVRVVRHFVVAGVVYVVVVCLAGMVLAWPLRWMLE